MDFTRKLPVEISEKCFGYLGLEDVKSAARVSPSWRKMILQSTVIMKKCRLTIKSFPEQQQFIELYGPSFKSFKVLDTANFYSISEMIAPNTEEIHVIQKIGNHHDSTFVVHKDFPVLKKVWLVDWSAAFDQFPLHVGNIEELHVEYAYPGHSSFNAPKKMGIFMRDWIAGLGNLKYLELVGCTAFFFFGSLYEKPTVNLKLKKLKMELPEDILNVFPSLARFLTEQTEIEELIVEHPRRCGPSIQIFYDTTLMECKHLKKLTIKEGNHHGWFEFHNSNDGIEVLDINANFGFEYASTFPNLRELKMSVPDRRSVDAKVKILMQKLEKLELVDFEFSDGSGEKVRVDVKRLKLEKEKREAEKNGPL
jgi:hypothetical protein